MNKEAAFAVTCGEPVEPWLRRYLGKLGINSEGRGEKTVANKALHLTAISLRSIAAGELYREAGKLGTNRDSAYFLLTERP